MVMLEGMGKSGSSSHSGIRSSGRGKSLGKWWTGHSRYIGGSGGGSYALNPLYMNSYVEDEDYPFYYYPYYLYRRLYYV